MFEFTIFQLEILRIIIYLSNSLSLTFLFVFSECLLNRLHELLVVTCRYASEHFEIINEDGRGKLAVHPYCQKPSAIYLDRGKACVYTLYNNS